MGSRPNVHKKLFFFILGVKVDSPMKTTRKRKEKLCERRTISFDADLYALAHRRMQEEGESMFSRYIQRLVQRDTAALRAQNLQTARDLLALNEGKAAAQPHTGPDVENATAAGNILRPSQSLGGGSSIRPTTMKYPKGGRRKLST
jgi:hypothetical protein